ncbi:MAG: hypothetical protein QOH71_1581 [Blastocatellia bacterium]|nr:hypothetical protein [Blastocatellia bacterium]
MESLWYQAVRSDDLRRLPVGRWMNRFGIFDGIKLALRLHRAAQLLVGFGNRNGFDPSHKCSQTERDILSASVQSTLKLCQEDSRRQFALRAQADRMSAFRSFPIR